MVSMCSIPGCSNTKKLHCLPKDPEIRRKWCLIVGRKDLIDVNTKQRYTYRICDLHFSEDMKFVPNKNRTNLKFNAVPSLYIPSNGIKPTLQTTSLNADTVNPSTLHTECIIKEETSMQSLSNKLNILDSGSKVSRSTSSNKNLKSVDILDEIETQDPNLEVENVYVKIENEDDIVKIVDEPDNEIDDNTSDDLGVGSSLEAKYNDLYKENQLLKNLLTKIELFPNLECNGVYTINTESNNLIDLTDIQNICRICLQKSDNLTSLMEQMVFENKNISNMIILEALQSIICDTVHITDNLPRHICTQCRNHLKSFVTFKYAFNRATSILHIIGNETFVNTNEQSVPAATMKDHDYSKNSSLKNEKCCTMELETRENYTNTDNMSVLSKNSEYLSKLRSPTRRNIFRHHLTHNQFKCEKCHRSFKKKSYLLSHMLVHNKTFPFRCVKCSRGFVIKSNYERHLLSHEDGEPLHKCIECGKGFSNTRHLSRHMTVHTENWTYSTKYRYKRCKYCGEGFSKKEQLVEHVCHQYGVYKCKYCFKVFLNSRTRQLHTHKVHFNGNKTPGCCPICNLTFKNINYHIATKHSKEKLKALCTLCGLYVMNIYTHMLKHRNVSTT